MEDRMTPELAVGRNQLAQFAVIEIAAILL